MDGNKDAPAKEIRGGVQALKPNRPEDRIPVIDLFAGPGGLAEGFAAVRTTSGAPAFRIGLSVEKDPQAHRTLELRALYRALLEDGGIPAVYYEYLRGAITRDQLFASPAARDAVAAAKKEAKHAELGVTTATLIDAWISDALAGRNDWVLVGGPPCQAYSLVGRARRTRVAKKVQDQDERLVLYKEYLRILRKFQPAVFVMENVKGLLSARRNGESMFSTIIRDLSLSAVRTTHRYHIRSFVVKRDGVLKPHDFVIKAEQYGIPQTRHRVILLGIRDDFSAVEPKLLAPSRSPPVMEIIGELPKLRSAISRGGDSRTKWFRAVSRTRRYLKALGPTNDAAAITKTEVSKRFSEAMREARSLLTTGGRFVPATKMPNAPATPLHQWLRDQLLNGWCNHDSRGHMTSDLRRYAFASLYADLLGESPNIRDFPRALLPKHSNVKGRAIPFKDRFRVQLANKVAKTVVAHISKDGHYFIHPDPAQARSLTVREAARLQTFPDNYFFEGERTEQFIQVGNAVPPWLAKQIGETVANLLQANAAIASTDVGAKLSASG